MKIYLIRILEFYIIIYQFKLISLILRNSFQEVFLTKF